jgi:hypothetical protein
VRWRLGTHSQSVVVFECLQTTQQDYRASRLGLGWVWYGETRGHGTRLRKIVRQDEARRTCVGARLQVVPRASGKGGDGFHGEVENSEEKIKLS